MFKKLENGYSRPFLILILFILFIAGCTEDKLVPTVTVAVTKTLAQSRVEMAVFTAPTPSHTPQPARPSVTPTATPTITAVSTQTPIPFPLAPMTPFPTVTPTGPEPKSIFLFYGNSGGDGGGYFKPSLVIYTDGQAILLHEENGAYTYVQTYVPPSELCSLRNEVEETGFLEQLMLDEYYTERVQSIGETNVIVQLENTFYSFYAPNVPYLVDELKPGHDKIASYQLSEPHEPFFPTNLSLKVIELTPDPEREINVEIWPPELPPLQEGVTLIEGDMVLPVFDLFVTNQFYGRFFQDGEKTYQVFPTPLLPHQTPKTYTYYPSAPHDYVSLLDCEGEASFISSGIPTSTPTLIPSAYQLTGKGKILFVTKFDGDDEIFVMEADGTNRMRLTNNSSDDWSPVWSPDGESVAFVSDRDGDSEIFVMAADGTSVMQLTHNEIDDYSPSWNSDGSLLAFVSDRDDGWERSEIYLMNSDGTQQQRLTNDARRNLNPEWTLDSHHITFVQEISDENYQLVTISVYPQDNMEERSPYFQQYPQFIWSPNRVMFATHNKLDNGDWEINLMDMDMVVTDRFPLPIIYLGSLNWTYDGDFIIFSGYVDSDLARNRHTSIFALDVDTGELIHWTFDKANRTQFELSAFKYL